MDKDKVLEKIYYDVDEGFGSVQDLYNKARKVDGGITLEYVRTWMRKQPNKQTNKELQAIQLLHWCFSTATIPV